VFGLGAAVENLWLTTVELGLGIQFVSAPMEIPEQWARIERLLDVPDDLALMAVYRVGHVPERPWSAPGSTGRRVTASGLGDYVFRNSCAEPDVELGAEGAEAVEAVEHDRPVHTHGGRDMSAPSPGIAAFGNRDRSVPARPGRREGDRPPLFGAGDGSDGVTAEVERLLGAFDHAGVRCRQLCVEPEWFTVLALLR
jgi:hypothetical protein